jgi:protease I
MAAKKLLMLVGDYVEDYEAMVPFQALLMVGHVVHAVCPNKKAGDSVRTAIHDFEGDQTYSEKRGHNFALNATFDDIRPEDYDALVIPGGRAPEYIRLNPRVLEIVRHFAHSGISPSPPSVTPRSCWRRRACWLGNRAVATPPSCSARCRHRRRGGTYAEVAIDQAHTCGKLVTAPAWPAHPAWLLAIPARSGHVVGSSQPKSLVQFFRESPLVGLELDFERDKDTGRDIEL